MHMFWIHLVTHHHPSPFSHSHFSHFDSHSHFSSPFLNLETQNLEPSRTKITTPYVRMEGHRCYAGTTPHRHCTHVHTNAKDKLRPFVTNSAFCGGFEPRTICYFPHHPTTWTHMTHSQWCIYGVLTPCRPQPQMPSLE